MLTWQRGEHADEKTVGPFKLDQKKAWLGSCSTTRRTSSRRSAKSWEFRERHFIVMRLHQNDENPEGTFFTLSIAVMSEQSWYTTCKNIFALHQFRLFEGRSRAF
jgi:hypothetical protein